MTDDIDVPPLVCSKNGEFRMPDDIWASADQIVKAFRSAESGEFGKDIDPDGFLQTLIASQIMTERFGMNRRQ